MEISLRPFGSRFDAEDEFEGAAGHQFLVGDVSAVEGFSVELDVFQERTVVAAVD